MHGKMIAIVVIAAALAGCQTASNQPTDAFVKRTLEGNATTMTPSVSTSVDGNFPVAPNS